jgi:hypothetical protein
MRQSDIIHKDFKPTPYWWEAYKPVADELADVPRSARVVIVGAGYAELSCAIELADAGSRRASSRLPSSVPGATRAAAAE